MKAGTYDPDYDFRFEESLANNAYPAAKMAAARTAEHTSLAAQFCTPELWDKLKNRHSSGPAKWTLARAINTGVMYPESFVGCHAGDREPHDDLAGFFHPVIERYHEGFSMEKGSDLAGTPSERMDASRIAVDLTESAKSKIVSTRIRVARNGQARGATGEHSEVIDRIDVSNWRRIGLPEYELVEDMINCANDLAEREDAL